MMPIKRLLSTVANNGFYLFIYCSITSSFNIIEYTVSQKYGVYKNVCKRKLMLTKAQKYTKNSIMQYY